jgi:hypothetical protein
MYVYVRFIKKRGENRLDESLAADIQVPNPA